jgi:hypothetical protein
LNMVVAAANQAVSAHGTQLVKNFPGKCTAASHGARTGAEWRLQDALASTDSDHKRRRMRLFPSYSIFGNHPSNFYEKKS